MDKNNVTFGKIPHNQMEIEKKKITRADRFEPSTFRGNIIF